MTVALPTSDLYQEKIPQIILNQKFNSQINSKVESASESVTQLQKNNTKMTNVTRTKIGISATSDYLLSPSFEQTQPSASDGAKIYQSNKYCTNLVQKRRWALGTMIIFFLFVLSSSTSSVSCVPLGMGTMSHFEELTSIPQQEQNQAQKSAEADVVVSRGIDDGRESPRNYIVQPKSQLYLPSLLKSSDIGIGDENSVRYGQQREQDEDGLRSYSNTKSSANYHPENIQNEDESTQAEWETVIDPHLYVLTEWNSNSLQQQQRMRRNVGPSLSIVNPLDVLRQRLLLEIARRKMRQSHNQIIANAEILKHIGRR